jgi:hypothetical protein
LFREEENDLLEIQEKIIDEEQTMEKDMLRQQLNIFKKLEKLNKEGSTPRSMAIEEENKLQSQFSGSRKILFKNNEKQRKKQLTRNISISLQKRRDHDKEMEEAKKNQLIQKIEKQLQVVKMAQNFEIKSSICLLPSIKKKKQKKRKKNIYEEYDITQDLYTNRTKLKDLMILIEKAQKDNEAKLKRKNRFRSVELLEALSEEDAKFDESYLRLGNSNSPKRTNIIRKKKCKPPVDFIKRNIQKFSSKNEVFYHRISQYYNSLFYKNIPKLIVRSHLPRKQLHRLFIQFKVLCLLTAHRIRGINSYLLIKIILLF